MQDEMVNCRVSTATDDIEKYPNYSIFDINDMLKIPSDKIDDFLLDLGHMLKASRMTVEISQLVDPNLNVEDIVELKEFTWVDDGKHDGVPTSFQINGKDVDLETVMKEGRKQLKSILDTHKNNVVE